MLIKYLGHATTQIVTEKATLLFDPFISGNELAVNIQIEKLKPDFILLSHGHQDHVADVIEIAKHSNCVIVSNYEIVTWFEAKGVKGHPMNIGGKWNFNFGEVKMVNALHSSVLPDGTYGGNPAGFVVKADNKTIYFAGDTALFGDMKLIGEYEKPDLAILPIGDNFTMGIEDAVRAAQFLGCKKVIGVHFDTFGFIKIDHQQARRKFEEHGIELVLLEIGKELNI